MEDTRQVRVEESSQKYVKYLYSRQGEELKDLTYLPTPVYRYTERFVRRQSSFSKMVNCVYIQPSIVFVTNLLTVFSMI